MKRINRAARKRLIESKPAEMTVREFCKLNNLKEVQYFYWKNSLNKENKAVREQFF